MAILFEGIQANPAGGQHAAGAVTSTSSRPPHSSDGCVKRHDWMWNGAFVARSLQSIKLVRQEVEQGTLHTLGVMGSSGTSSEGDLPDLKPDMVIG